MSSFGPPSTVPELPDSGPTAGSGPRPMRVLPAHIAAELAETLIAPSPAAAAASGDVAPTLVVAGAGRPAPRAPRPLLAAGIGALVLGAAATGYFYAQRGKGRPPYVPASASVGSAASGPCPAGMGLVSGDVFRIGSDDGKDDERPVHEVTVATFCLDLTEVRAGDYFDCMQRDACRPSESTVRWMDITDEAKERESAQCVLYQTDSHDRPMNCLSWDDADAYCRTAGKRLPTEAEWEYAAAGGSEGRRFPWGHDPPGPDLANVCDRSCIAAEKATVPGRPMFDADDRAERIAPVGQYPRGASRFGMLDMAGNVWEWTASPYCTYPEHDCASQYRVFRGGGWGGKFAANLRTSARMWSNPSHRYNDVGLRCAKDAR